MRIRISQLDLPPGYTPEQLIKAAARKVRGSPSVLRHVKTVRRSVDARGRYPRMTVTVEAEHTGRLPNGLRDVEKARDTATPTPAVVHNYSGPRPLVVGAGPAGLMAALGLAEAGLNPILVERGEPAAPRAKRVEAFWSQGTFTAESNVLYGEGGAGLFSDGKLTSRSKDRPRVRRFLETLVACGAPPDILIDAEPHVGSDVLAEVVPALRNRITDLGGDVRFGTRLERLAIEDAAVRGVTVSGESLATNCCVLATGHSARDVYEMLSEQGVLLEPKPFAIGLRLEIPQKQIDTAQWGGSFPMLGSASFRMTRREEGNARACYTFCMCPGGLVIACASSEGLMTTNGMSLSTRDKPFGNAAFLVPVFPGDFPTLAKVATHSPVSNGYASNSADSRVPELAGIAFQQRLEAIAFTAGGSDYSLPAQRLIDFLDGAVPSDLPAARSCTRARPAQLRGLLPDFVERTLLSAIPKMLRGMRGVQIEQALLYASETRSSSPVRVVREEDGQSTGVRGLYPCGEGAGHAGGIVSSGIDGLRIAEAIAAGG